MGAWDFNTGIQGFNQDSRPRFSDVFNDQGSVVVILNGLSDDDGPIVAPENTVELSNPLLLQTRGAPPGFTSLYRWNIRNTALSGFSTLLRNTPTDEADVGLTLIFRDYVFFSSITEGETEFDEVVQGTSPIDQIYQGRTLLWRSGPVPQ